MQASGCHLPGDPVANPTLLQSRARQDGPENAGLPLGSTLCCEPQRLLTKQICSARAWPTLTIPLVARGDRSPLHPSS